MIFVFAIATWGNACMCFKEAAKIRFIFKPQERCNLTHRVKAVLQKTLGAFGLPHGTVSARSEPRVFLEKTLKIVGADIGKGGNLGNA